jgi:hypothetical protein
LQQNELILEEIVLEVGFTSDIKFSISGGKLKILHVYFVYTKTRTSVLELGRNISEDNRLLKDIKNAADVTSSKPSPPNFKFQSIRLSLKGLIDLDPFYKSLF